MVLKFIHKNRNFENHSNYLCGVASHAVIPKVEIFQLEFVYVKVICRVLFLLRLLKN